MLRNKAILVALVSLFSQVFALDTLLLPQILSNGMVLQQGEQNKIWGWAEPGDKISIKGDWMWFKRTAMADDLGVWLLEIPAPKAGGPYQLELKSQRGETLLIRNIVCGEVWIASGQSNMEMPVGGSDWTYPIDDAESYIATANYPDIRMFTVEKSHSLREELDVRGSWVVCTPETVPYFSAAAYVFGKRLHEELAIPIGIIHSSWGGTPAESWTTPQTMRTLGGYEDQLDAVYSGDLEMDKESQEVLMNKWVEGRDSVYSDLKHINYAGIELVESDWKTMSLPGRWEQDSSMNIDGVVWFRKHVVIPDDWAGKRLTLSLGPIDDYDHSYWNGSFLGTMGPNDPNSWSTARTYTIPAELVKAGENVIAIRVFDDKGGGGLHGDPDQYLVHPQSGDPDMTLSISGDWLYKIASQFDPAPVRYIDQYSPGVLYHAMIVPLKNYQIRGAIWYQGESNHMRGMAYRTLFPAMISDWRQLWNQGNFPFYYVQIAPFKYIEPQSAPYLMEAQAMTMNLSPNTGMIVTTDIGNISDIHPTNKVAVGERLASWALAKTYGRDNVTYTGPIFERHEIEDGQIRLHFLENSVSGGLVINGSEATHFEIAGPDQVFYPADAKIDGRTIIVQNSEVKIPSAVRFGWSNTAEPNLFNGAGLPAIPFRTDNWD